VTLDTISDWAGLVTIIAGLQGLAALIHRVSAKALIADTLAQLERKFMPREVAETRLNAIETGLGQLAIETRQVTRKSPDVLGKLQALVIEIGLTHREVTELKADLARELARIHQQR
jgi:hypothetical protein